MQERILKPSALLREDGTLLQRGWATAPLLSYDRRQIKAPRYRIKEWDYYCVLSQSHGVAFTVADLGYLGLVSVTLLDFTIPKAISKSIMIPFPLGSFALPPTSGEGDIVFENKKLLLKFLKRKEQRLIILDFPRFADNRSLKGEISLQQPPTLESMTIATPFPRPKHAFYYNQKINCLAASGRLQWGNQSYSFDPHTSFGVLDWGRGVWPYANSWYWGSASGLVEDQLFGFNIGYGFGDTSLATENMLFYQGRGHKLAEVRFHLPHRGYLDPWRFESSDSRFTMSFQPLLDRHSHTNLLFIESNQHQLFGRFTGKAILDSGKELQIKDFLGFAEKVYNRW